VLRLHTWMYSRAPVLCADLAVIASVLTWDFILDNLHLHLIVVV